MTSPSGPGHQYPPYAPPHAAPPQNWGQQPYYPGPHGYPGPNGHPVQPGGRGKMPFVVIGLALLLVAGGAGAFVLLSGDDDSGTGSGTGQTGTSAKGVVKTYMEEAKDDDLDGAKAVSCDRWVKVLDAIERDPFGEGGLQDYEIGRESTDGDTTVVDVKVTLVVNGEQQTLDVQAQVVKEDGTLKVCGLGQTNTG